MSKYLKVEVSRSQYTDVYLKVPDNFLLKDITKSLLKEAVLKTVEDYEWELEKDFIEYEGYEEIEESVAKNYAIFEVEERL